MEKVLIKNSSDILRNLTKSCDFDTWYDEELLYYLQDSLGLSKDNDIYSELDLKHVEVEELLYVLFSAFQPYSIMMSDILQLFAKYGIKEANQNLEIEFDFDKQKEKEGLKFDFNDFMKWSEVIKKASYYIMLYKIDNNSINKVNKLIDEIIETDTLFDNVISEEGTSFNDTNTELKEWLKEYYDRKCYPKYFPKIYKTNNIILDNELNKIWLFIKSLYDLFLSLEISYYEIRKKHCELIDKDGMNVLQDILLGEYDFIIGRMIKRLNKSAQNLKKMSNEEQEENALKINIIFKSLPKVKNKIYDTIKVFEQILSLPIWKYRYELYAIWIFSHIADELGKDNCLILHHKNGKIIFPFKGTKLATYHKNVINYELWTELRTKCYITPIGNKSRKENIQPDYTIKTNGDNDIDSSILVIECKQYKKESKSNFLNAVTDYANNRPNANIVLVNYGDISFKLENQVEDSIRNRVKMIGSMRPGNTNKIKEFRQFLNNVLLKDNKEEIFELIKSKFELTWSNKPTDLDIHLTYVDNSGDKFELSYKENEINNAAISSDMMNSFGYEYINIKEWNEGKYILWVNNFSKEIPLADSKAIIQISNKIINQKFICPNTGAGEIWIIMEVDTKRKTKIIKNEIVTNLEIYQK